MTRKSYLRVAGAASALLLVASALSAGFGYVIGPGVLHPMNLNPERVAQTAAMLARTGARKEDFEVVGIEPHAGMREELVKKELRGVTVQDGDAGHMPVEDGWGDALITAQVSYSDLWLGQ